MSAHHFVRPELDDLVGLDLPDPPAPARPPASAMALRLFVFAGILGGRSRVSVMVDSEMLEIAGIERADVAIGRDGVSRVTLEVNDFHLCSVPRVR